MWVSSLSLAWSSLVRGKRHTTLCIEEGCTQMAQSRDWCKRHYRKQWKKCKTKLPLWQLRLNEAARRDLVCSVEGCTRRVENCYMQCNGCRAKDYRKENPQSAILWAAKSRSKEFGLEFNLTLEDIYIPDICPVLGIKLEFGLPQSAKDNSPALDRLDNSKGYVKGNVNIISQRANRIKNDATYQELRAVAMWMREKELGLH